MTTTDDLLSDPPDEDLPEFEGLQPVGVVTRVNGAGQRIHRPMRIDERIVIVIEAEVADVNHRRTDDGVKRVHTLKCLDLFEIGGRAGKRLVNNLKQRYREGDVDSLPFKTAGDEALVADVVGTTDASGVAMTPDELAELGIADPSNDPVMVVLSDGTRALWPDDWGTKAPARPAAGDMIRVFSGDGELQVRELVDAESGETIAEWTDADENARLLDEEREAEAAEARGSREGATVVVDGHNFTPSRRRALDVLHSAMPDAVRVGVGMWDDDGPAVVSPAPAHWLADRGFVIRADEKHVELTKAGSDAWDRLHDETGEGE